MTYVRKNKEVNAIQLKGKVFDEKGVILALKDDWLLTEGEEQYYMTDAAFKREFELKPLDTPQYVPWPMPYEPCIPIAPWYDTWTSDKITFEDPLKRGTGESPTYPQIYLSGVSNLTEVGIGELQWGDGMLIYTADIDNVDLKVSFNVT
jgi:hypothetical protein